MIPEVSEVDLAATFAAMPNAEPVDGVPDAWTWSHAPKFGFGAVLSEDGKHAFQCYAHASWDADVAHAVLSFAREHSADLLADQPLVVVPGFSSGAFDIVASVSPGIHQYHNDKPDVHNAVRAVFPAYTCEFSGAEGADDAAFRYSRASGAQPTRWGREPNPYLKMRMRAATGREIAERGFVNPPKLVQELTELPERADGFVEFENYEQRVWTVTWADGYQVTESDGSPTSMSKDELLEHAKTVLLGPNRAAGEGSFSK